jgi:hypothetical protein
MRGGIAASDDDPVTAVAIGTDIKRRLVASGEFINEAPLSFREDSSFVAIKQRPSLLQRESMYLAIRLLKQLQAGYQPRP